MTSRWFGLDVQLVALRREPSIEHTEYLANGVGEAERNARLPVTHACCLGLAEAVDRKDRPSRNGYGTGRHDYTRLECEHLARPLLTSRATASSAQALQVETLRSEEHDNNYWQQPFFQTQNS